MSLVDLWMTGKGTCSHCRVKDLGSILRALACCRVNTFTFHSCPNTEVICILPSLCCALFFFFFSLLFLFWNILFGYRISLCIPTGPQILIVFLPLKKHLSVALNQNWVQYSCLFRFAILLPFSFLRQGLARYSLC